VSGFAIPDNLVLVAVLTVAVARNQLQVKGFLSQLVNFISESSLCAIHNFGLLNALLQ
jgi:hypothetical protein